MTKGSFRKTIFLSLSIFTVVQSTCFAAVSAKKSVKEANKLYQKGKIDEALVKYNDASINLPDSDIINFNMGAALYKKEDYQKAIDAFTRALTSDNKKIEADALYNLGNCKYRLGKLKENTDLSATVGLLRESLDYYKRAVELDQKNTDARFNHEFVERELKVLLDKLKQQGSSEDKQRSQQEKQQEQQKQASGSTGKEQAQDEKEKEQAVQAQEQEKQQQEKQKEGQGAEAKQEEKQEKEAQPAGEEAQQEEQGKELSEEGARAILERYGQEEAAPNYEDRRSNAYDREVSKDW